jgi:hypothetical protein
LPDAGPGCQALDNGTSRVGRIVRQSVAVTTADNYTTQVCDALAAMLTTHKPFDARRTPVGVTVRPDASGVGVEAVFAVQQAPGVKLGYRFQPEAGDTTSDGGWSPQALAGLLLDEIAADLDTYERLPTAASDSVHWMNA